MKSRATLSRLLPILIVSGLACAQDSGELGWPWGPVVSGSPFASLQKQDLYNLGLMGAKARDADAPEPEIPTASGRRSFKSSGRKGPDVGPRRLRVRAIYPGGPAARGGLKLDDVISAVNGISFDAGCLDPLATALMEAESGERRGKLVLQVERSTRKGPESLELEIKIPSGGKDALAPTAGKAREKIHKAALDWLAKHQRGDGGFTATLGGVNGEVVQTCLGGMAWITGGSSLGGGRHAAAIRKAYESVLRGLKSGDPLAGLMSGEARNWDQTTWGYAYTAIFLGELHAARKNAGLRRELQGIVDVLESRQEEGGGYGHGPGGANALGYIELNILGSCVLSGLGLAQRAGCQVDPQVVAKLCAYLEASGSEDGGVGYSTSPGQKGMGNIGRTAAAWLGMVALGKAQEPWCQKLRSYTRAHVAGALHGHASLMQHIFFAGVAAKALGDEATGVFWETMLRDLVLARAPDGSFQPRPWHESLLMQSNTDVSMGEVWTTASWAVVLAAEGVKKGKGGLAGLCARDR